MLTIAIALPALQTPTTTVQGALQGIRMKQPLFVRLQAMEEGYLVFWESIPQSFSDHTGVIDAKVLGLLVSSNAESIDIHRDDLGNLWLVANYFLQNESYMSTLMWVSSETTGENISIPEQIPFPQEYPGEVEPFLIPGSGMEWNESFTEVAEGLKASDMVETIWNILDYVYESQTYDVFKIDLLMSGTLVLNDTLDFPRTPIETMEDGTSICLERAIYIAALMRAAGVPSRTFTSAHLKTWNQVWLPNLGWVDVEAMCDRPKPQFPRSLTFSIPWVVQNSSDITFPYMWVPERHMRIANLTFSYVGTFDIDHYGTVLLEPVEKGIFEEDMEAFSFPIVFEPETISLSVIKDNQSLFLNILRGEETAVKKPVLSASTQLVFDVENEASAGDFTVSFTATMKEGFVVLEDFKTRRTVEFDLRLVLLAIGIPVAAILLWWYLRRSRF